MVLWFNDLIFVIELLQIINETPIKKGNFLLFSFLSDLILFLTMKKIIPKFA